MSATENYWSTMCRKCNTELRTACHCTVIPREWWDELRRHLSRERADLKRAAKIHRCTESGAMALECQSILEAMSMIECRITTPAKEL